MGGAAAASTLPPLFLRPARVLSAPRMSLFTILLGGELARTARLEAQIAGSRVIAADSGIRHAAKLGLEPELWAGDFDSVTAEDRADHAAIPVAAYPSDKDSTDGEIAVDEAISRGATRLVLAGAFGGPRADHAFRHLSAALALAESGLEVLLTSGWQEGVPLLPGTLQNFDYAGGTLFSVIGFTDLEALTLTGAKWPLHRRRVPFGSSLTLSNEVRGRLTASLEAGRAMLIAHPQVH
jgi:thiamine pyrophosphokinase